MSERKAILNTLDLNARQRAALLQKLDEQAVSPVNVPNRRSLRISFDHARAIVFKPMDDHGTDMRYTVQPRNISRWGVSVIHGRFVYPETQCIAAIPTREGKYTVHTAVVRRCRHVKGMVHELSLVFSEPVDLRVYVELNEEQRVIIEHEAEQDAQAGNRLG